MAYRQKLKVLSLAVMPNEDPSCYEIWWPMIQVIDEPFGSSTQIRECELTLLKVYSKHVNIAPKSLPSNAREVTLPTEVGMHTSLSGIEWG